MAENIRLETTVSMNTRPLERNIATASAKLKALNKSLRDQSKHFKQAGEDADGLAAREEALTEAMDEQNVMIAEKEKALAKVKSEIKDTTAMTNKETKAIERARAELSQARYGLRAYETDMRKTRASMIKLNDSTLDMSKSMDSLSIKSARVASEYRKQGDEVNALMTEYHGLGRQIDVHNKKIAQEEAILKKIGSTINETGKEYNDQQIHITKLNNEHIKLMKTYDKVGVSLNRAQADNDNNSRGMIRAYLATTKANGAIERGGRAWKGFTNSMHSASATINRLGSTFRNIGLVIGGMALGGLIQNISTLVPLAGSLVSVMVGLGGAMTAVAGGAIGMYGAFGIAGLAVKVFAGQAQTALQMVEDGEMKATAELSRYKNALSGLQTQWKGVVQGNQAAIFNTMANGIDIARFALTKLNPFITKTANQISKFSGRMHTWVTESNNASKAFGMLNKIGPPIFQNILNAVFKVTDGLTHMLTQFAPLFTWTAAGLEKIANEFNKWANSASTDKGIASFIEYTKRNLPIVGAIFWNVFSGIIDLFMAFGGHSEFVMRGMAGVTQSFKDWASSLSSTEGFKNFIAYLEENGPKVWEVLKNIGSIIVNVIKGLAPIGAIMLDFLVPFTEFMVQLTKYPAFGAFLGILAAFIGIIMQLAPPILLIVELVKALGGLATIWGVITSIASGIATAASVIGGAIGAITLPVWGAIAAIVALIGFLAWLNTKIEPVDWGPIFSKMGQALSDAWDWTVNILKIRWNQFITMLTPLGLWLKGVWDAIWQPLSGGVSRAMNAVVGAIRWVFTTAMSIFSYFGGILSAAWGFIWGGIKNIASGNMTGLSNSLRAIWTGIVNFARWIFNGLKTFFVWIWNGIKFAVMWAINGISNIIRVVFTSVVAFIRWVWGGVKTFFSWIWNGIRNAVMWAVNGISNVIRVIFTSVVNFIKWIWNGVASFFSWIWNSKILAPVRWALQAINVVVRIIFAAIGAFIRWIWNGIASFFRWVWNGIRNTVVGGATRIWNGIKFYWNIVSTFTRNIFNSVKNFLVWIWNNIRVRVVGFVIRLWNSIKFYWNIVSTFTRNIFNSVKNFIVWVWNNIRARVVAVVRVLWRNITTVWNAIASTTRRIFNYIKNWVIWLWNNIRNRVVAVARALWKSISGVWNAIASTTRRVFNYIRNWLVWLWNSLKNKVVSIARSLWNTVRGIWNALASGTRKVFNSIRSFLTWLWTVIRNKVTSVVRSLWNGVRGTWNNLTSGTKRIFNSVRNYLVDKWNGIKNSVTGIASDLWSSVKQTFTNMKNGLGGLADKIGGVITGMVKGIKKGLNSLIKGVNWVAEKLGVDEKIPELSTGTGGVSYAGSGVGAGVSNGVVSSGGFATVNDRGPGNGTGSTGHQEVIQRANGQMFAPKGKDVTVPLQKGDIVHNGKAVQRAQKAGALPKFSTGTKKKKKYDLLRQQKKHGEGGMDGLGSNIPKSTWGPSAGGFWKDAGKMKDALVGTAKEGTKKAAVDTTKKMADTTKTAAKITGDLLEYVGNPMKLVDDMLGKFGVKFGDIKGQIPKDMMWDPMWKGLKGGVKSLFDGWLTEAEGAGDGGYIDLSHGINFGFGSNVPGYPFGRHDGLDIGYPYGSKLYSTLKGKATAKKGWNGGFGNMVSIKSGVLEAIYGHMSSHAFSGTKNVEPGTYIGKSGGDPGRQGAGAGQSTGAHLHYEMRRNGKPFDPTNWLKENNGSGGKGKWKSTVKKALKIAGLPTSGKYVNAWLKQIQTESGGNAKAMGGTDGLADGRAKGLVQVKPGTFNAYKMKGHGNIMKGLDNLIAGMRYANSRYGNAGLGVIGKGHGYAKGTNFASSGLANVFEKGGEIMNLRGGEQIIPNDVSIAAIKQMMNSNIFDKTQSAVYNAISNYADALRNKEESKRVKQLQEAQNANANTNDIKELKSMFENMLYLMQKQLGVQEDIAESGRITANKDLNMDGEKVTKMTSEQEAFNLMMSNYSSGITRR